MPKKIPFKQLKKYIEKSVKSVRDFAQYKQRIFENL